MERVFLIVNHNTLACSLLHYNAIYFDGTNTIGPTIPANCFHTLLCERPMPRKGECDHLWTIYTQEEIDARLRVHGFAIGFDAIRAEWPTLGDERWWGLKHPFDGIDFVAKVVEKQPRGTGADVIIIDEAAYIDRGLFFGGQWMNFSNTQ